MPIQDANSIALKAVQAAGDGGGVVLNFTPPEALKILQAAQQQGLQDRVKWGCSTPCNTDFLAEALGTRVGRQAGRQRRAQPDHRRRARQQRSTGQVREAVRAATSRSAASARWASSRPHRHRALLELNGDYTPGGRQRGDPRTIKNFKTDILCKPWYFGDAPFHIPNNVDRTVTPKDGVMVGKEECFPISDVDPADRSRCAAIEQAKARQPDAAVRRRSSMPELGRVPAVHRHRPGSRAACMPSRESGWWCSTGPTGVLNLAFGAVGRDGRADRVGADQQRSGSPEARRTSFASCSAAVVTLLYGLLFGPPLASRDPLVKATATLGLALILLGTMSWIWSDKARSMILPTSNENFMVGDVLRELHAGDRVRVRAWSSRS